MVKVAVKSRRQPLVSVMLAVADAQAAIAWYRRALGATELWNGTRGFCLTSERRHTGAIGPLIEAMMNDDEAIGVLERELASFRDEAYADLARRIGAGALHRERIAPSGTSYQVEVQFFWDDQPGGNIRVMGSVDDSGWRAFKPLSRDFIKSPDGSFVGE
jgi:catechol 2,3-dioxygenase-like lactoylglutathione lyase family enzyme